MTYWIGVQQIETARQKQFQCCCYQYRFVEVNTDVCAVCSLRLKWFGMRKYSALRKACRTKPTFDKGQFQLFAVDFWNTIPIEFCYCVQFHDELQSHHGRNSYRIDTLYTTFFDCLSLWVWFSDVIGPNSQWQTIEKWSEFGSAKNENTFHIGFQRYIYTYMVY